MTNDLTGTNVLGQNSSFIAEQGSTVDLSQTNLKIPLAALRGPPGFKGDDALISYTVKKSNFNAKAGMLIAVDTSAGAVAVTLPLSPNVGDTITLIDAKNSWATNNLVLVGNGSNIHGSAANLPINFSGAIVILIYIDSVYGWC